MTFNLYNVIGASVWDPLVLTPADLRNGVQSWRTKIDPDELVRLERYRRGGSYFDPDAGP
jgi:alkaline phosphatase D